MKENVNIAWSQWGGFAVRLYFIGKMKHVKSLKIPYGHDVTFDIAR